MSSLYTKFVSSLIFPFHEKLKKHTTVRDLKELEQSQWLTGNEIKKIQGERLHRFMQHCYKHVPYYKKMFEAHNIVPDDIKQADDLSKLPFLNKDIIRANIHDLKADNASTLSSFNTGGSSGQPLIFYIGNERISRDVAAKWRATRWWDVDIGDKEIVVWGSPIELGAQDYVRMVRDKLIRTTLLPAFEMSEEKTLEFIDAIQGIRPSMLFGYPSSLSLIAKTAHKHNRVLNNLGIKVSFVTSEVLYPEQREWIEKIFGCPVANGYGGRDAGFIAHQCPEGNMHITAEDIIVEIVDQKGNILPYGESGEVVITHLATGEFPFVRYKTGDIAVLSEENCACGRGLPLLKDIQGRSTDFIIAKDGTVMHGLALIYVLRDIEGVELFKVVQESLDKTQIHIKTNDQYSEQDEQRILDTFYARLGQGVEVSIDYVDDIPREKSGKFRYVISHVSINEVKDINTNA